MNKKEPKKSPAVDFFAWLHFAAAKRNPDVSAGSSSWLEEISRTTGLSQNPLQGFFLNACAAFARAAQKSQGRGREKSRDKECNKMSTRRWCIPAFEILLVQ
ncbi:MAG: hypothetical protein R3281_15420 [Balneolaceae bacterium]|nr:hypothetical protein [Balneolaceae bacterium]